jgi:hypothetical protein
MDDATRQKILDEAKAMLATKDQAFVPPPVDPLTKWRDEAAALEAKYEQGARDVREEEAQQRHAAEANPTLWDQWFAEQLKRHLPRLLDPSLKGIAEGIGELYSELRRRADAQEKTISEQRKTINGLQLECAQLATKLAELKTDAVLAAMPIASTLRGTVN